MATFTNLADDTAETITLGFTGAADLAGSVSRHHGEPGGGEPAGDPDAASPTATAGQAFGTQPVIYEEDRYGNLETGDNTTW